MSDGQAKISIILPTYNGERFLSQSLQSCLNQTHQNLELVIVDDASGDRTEKIIRSIDDRRVKYLRQDKNAGLVASLNKGFAASSGEYLTWTSDDNYYDPKALETMRQALLSSDADFVYACYQMVDSEGKILRPGRIEEPKGLDKDNYVGGCFLYTRRVYTTVGDFNPDAFLAEDYEYWLRVRQKFRMVKINQPLYYYRIHDGSLTAEHKEAKVQEQVEKVRAGFIKPWKQSFFLAQKHFNAKNFGQARKYAWTSWIRNPFYGPTWRLLALLHLNASFVNLIRRLKNFSK